MLLCLLFFVVFSHAVVDTVFFAPSCFVDARGGASGIFVVVNLDLGGVSGKADRGGASINFAYSSRMASILGGIFTFLLQSCSIFIIFVFCLCFSHLCSLFCSSFVVVLSEFSVSL